jgi:chemotaxis protein CheX
MNETLPLETGNPEAVEPFMTATRLTFQEMLGTTVAVTAVQPGIIPGTEPELVAILALQADVAGMLCLHFPLPTAQAIAERMLADVVVEREEALLRDCLGEVANVVAGQAKALLSGTLHAFALSTPVVTTSDGLNRSLDSASVCFSIAFQSALGPFSLQVSQPFSQAN